MNKNIGILRSMPQKTKHKRIMRALSLLLCAAFLLVMVSRDFEKRSTSESTFLQSLTGQNVSMSVVTKIAPLFLIKEACTDNPPANLFAESSFNWRSLPRALRVSLFERNYFYVLTSINAP
jgi:hypothetical protein